MKTIDQLFLNRPRLSMTRSKKFRVRSKKISTKGDRGEVCRKKSLKGPLWRAAWETEATTIRKSKTHRRVDQRPFPPASRIKTNCYQTLTFSKMKTESERLAGLVI